MHDTQRNNFRKDYLVLFSDTPFFPSLSRGILTMGLTY